MASSGGASASVNKKIMRKNATGNRSDVGWQRDYEVENDDRRIKCKYCKKVVTRGVYHLKHHLACTKKDVGACPSVSNEVKKFMLQIFLEMDENSSSRKMYGLDGEENGIQNIDKTKVGEKQKERDIRLGSFFKRKSAT